MAFSFIISAFVVNILLINTIHSFKIQHSPSFILAFSFLSITNAQNTTTIPESTTPLTTEFFTTETGSPTSPTTEPTLNPTYNPTTSPSRSPTIALGSAEEVLVQVTVALEGTGIDKAWAERNEATLIQMFKDGLSDSESITVIIGEITELYNTESTRRIMAEEVIGVEIEYLVVIDDAQGLNVLTQSIDSGSFNNEFQQALNDNFEGIEMQETAYQNKGIGDGDDFLGKTKATFGEKMASPYILLGIVLGVVGVVWLLFLRTDIKNNYPSYLSVASDAVEMVPQTSAASGPDTQ